MSRDKLTSKGGTVELRLVLDNYGADEGTIYYRVRKKTITPEGYPMWDEVQTNVPTQISKENPIIKVTLPENTTEKEEEYQITPTSKKGTYTNLKGVSVTVIPASQDEEYTNNSAFSAEDVYRVKAVDAEGVSGYQLQYSTNKKFAKSVKTSTISKNTTIKKTVKKLSAKKTYYVRVRTYKTVKVGKKSVKIYSGWSAAKKVKTK